MSGPKNINQDLQIQYYINQGELLHNQKNLCLDTQSRKSPQCIFYSEEFLRKEPKYIDAKDAEYKFFKNDMHHSNTEIHNFQKVKRKKLNSFLQSNQYQNMGQIAKIIISMLRGLAQFHSKNIIYTCLSPENLYLNQEQQIIFKAELKHLYFDMLYLAPEILEEKKYGFEADVFSFGVLIYEMIYKKHPFDIQQQNTKQQLIQAIKQQEIVFDSQEPVPPYLIHFIQGLLKYDPENRMSWIQVYRHPFISRYIDQYYNEENKEDQLQKLRKLKEDSLQIYYQKFQQGDQIPNFQVIELNKSYNNTKQRKSTAQSQLEQIYKKTKFLVKYTKKLAFLEKANADPSSIVFYTIRYVFHIIHQIMENITNKQNNIFQISNLDDFTKDKNNSEKFRAKIENSKDEYKKMLDVIILKNEINEGTRPLLFMHTTNLNQLLSSFKKDYKDALYHHARILDRLLGINKNDQKKLFILLMLTFQIFEIVEENNLKQKINYKQMKKDYENIDSSQYQKIIDENFQKFEQIISY